MKTLILSFVLISTTLISNDDLSWVDKQVEAIKPPRDGESNDNISNIKDPFIFLKKNFLGKNGKKALDKQKAIYKKSRIRRTSSNSRSSTSSRFPKYNFKLSAIINKSALINGKWYKLGDKIKGCKIIDVNKNTVTLKYKSSKKVLTTASKTKLKFKK